MPDFSEGLLKALKILRSDKKSLKELAGISGVDVFRFFNHADLRNLDLSHQDLTGLNFFGVDFGNTRLDGISYDVGAFNGSKVLEKYSSLIDDFDFCLSDILDDLFKYLYVFVQIRPESLERTISTLRISYQGLANHSNINVGTLRKARRGEIIALETAQSVASSLLQIEDEKSRDIESQLKFKIDLRQRRRNLLLQPMIKLSQFSNSDGFKIIRSVDLRFFTTNREVIKRNIYDGLEDPQYRFIPSVIENFLT